MLLAGAAEVDITPEVGCDLAGGAFGASTGVHHALQAEVLLLEDGFHRVAVVSCDLLGFDVALADVLREAVAATLRADAVLLAATHTHCGPVTLDLGPWGGAAPGYCDHLRRSLCWAAERAVAALEPVRLRAGVASATGLGTNRTSYGEAVDVSLPFLRLDDAAGQPRALIVNPAIHPVEMHNTGLIGADYPGVLRARLRDALGAHLVVPVLLGAAGDVNPDGFTAQTGGRLADAARELARARCRATGQALADAVIAAFDDVGPVADGLAVAHTDLSLPLATLPDADALSHRRDAAVAWLRGHPDQGPTDWTRAEHVAERDWCMAALAGDLPPTCIVHLQALRLGPAILLGMPLELFARWGLALRESTPAPLLLACLANGYHGYVAAPEAYQRGTYEAVGVPQLLGTRPFAPAVSEVVVAAAADLVNRLWETHRQCPTGWVVGFPPWEVS